MTCWRFTGARFERDDGAIASHRFGDDEAWDEPKKYRTLALADVNGDGKADLCGRGAVGVRCFPSTGAGFGAELRASMYRDDNGWDQEIYYGTIRLGR